MEGDACNWDGFEYQIRHVITGRLVTLIEQNQKKHLSLSGHPFERQSRQTSRDNSTFTFISSNVEKENQIHFNAIVKVQNTRNALQLQITNEEWHKQKNVNYDEQLIGDLHINTENTHFTPIREEGVISRYQTVFSNKPSEQDAFLLLRPDPLEIQELEFIMSSQSLLQSFASIFKHGELPEKAVTQQLEQTLTDLIIFLTDSDEMNPLIREGAAIVRRQKFVRELGIIDLICNILHFPFQTGLISITDLTADHFLTYSIKLCYKLLKQAAKDYRLNETYCAQWLGLFLEHAQKASDQDDIHAEATLTEMLDGNKFLLEKHINSNIIEKFIRLCRDHQRHERFLVLLSALCVCEGEAIVVNQNTICEILLQIQENKNSLLMPVQMSVTGQVEVFVNEYQEWIELRRFKEISHERDGGRLYNYFNALLGLVADLGFDRNYHMVDLTKIYTFDIIYTGISSQEIPAELRSRMIRVLLSLHIDQGDVGELTVPNYIRVWQHIGDDSSGKIIQSKVKLSQNILGLKNYIKDYLVGLNGEQSTSRVNENLLTKAILDFLHFMLTRGFYESAEEIAQLIDPLVKILNGTNDDISNISSTKRTARTSSSSLLTLRQTITTTQTRYEVLEGTETITECKQIICKILGFIIDMRVDFRISKFLINFKEGTRQQSLRSSSTLELGLFNFPDIQIDTSQYEIPEDMEAPVSWLNNILQQQTLDIIKASNSNLVAILIDLIQYKNSSLASEAFQLLMRIFSQHESFLKALEEVQLLEHGEAIQTLTEVKGKLTELASMSENAENWLGKCVPFANAGNVGADDAFFQQNTTETIEIIKYMIQLCSERINMGPRKSFVIQHSSTRIFQLNSQNLGDTQEIWQSFTNQQYNNEDKSVKEPELFYDNDRPMRENQRLLRNLKAYIPVIELIKHKGIPQQMYSMQRHNIVLRHCYVFLSKFCRNNPENQLILHQYIDLFMEDFTKNIYAASLIREIYQNNFSLLSNLSIKVLRNIVDGIDEVPMSSKKCQMLDIAKVFMTCNNKLLKNNQSEVLNQLATSNRDNVLNLLSDQKEQAEILQVLQTINNQAQMQVPDKINYLLTQLEVMTLSAWDKSGEAEEVCEKLLPLDQYKTLLEASGRFWPLKKALVLFFLHVYLDIEYLVNADEISQWNTLEVICKDMNEIILSFSNMTNKFTMGEHVIEESEAALSYVFQAAIPCLKEIFEKRGNTLPTDTKPEVIQNIIELCCQYYRIAPSAEDRTNAAGFLVLITEIQKLQKFIPQDYPLSSHEVYEVKNTTVRSPGRVQDDDNFQGVMVNKFRDIVDGMCGLDIVHDSIECEFEEMIRYFVRIEQVTREHFGESMKITSKSVLLSIIQLLSKGNTIGVQGLKILRKVIEVENRRYTTPAAEWDTKDWIDFAEYVSIRQNLLVELGAVPLVCKIFTETESQKIIAEAFLTVIAMLLGGNKTVQDEFLLYFKNDHSNSLVLKLRKLVIGMFESVKKRETIAISNSEKQYKADLNGLFDVELEDDEDEEERNYSKKRHETSFQILVNLLRFLQLLCEGHHIGLQNYLREQQQSNRDFNFVLSVSGMLRPYLRFLHQDNIQLGFQILDLLTELVQGPCRENQRVLSHAKIIDAGRDILASLKSNSELNIRGFTDPLSEDIGELKYKAVNFLLSLLEGDADQEILRRIFEAMDFRGIKERMYEVFSTFIENELNLDPDDDSLNTINNKLTSEHLESSISEGFNLFILISKLADDYSPARIHLKESSFSKQEYKAFSFFRMHTGRIEVLVNETLTRTYFPIQPSCKFISENSKNLLMQTVNRESPSSKITDLMIQAEDLIEEMQHNEQQYRSRITITNQIVFDLRDISMLIVLFTNYLILKNFGYDDDDNVDIPNEVSMYLIICGFILIGMSALVLVAWSKVRMKLIILKGWRLYVDSVSKFEKQVYSEMGSRKLNSKEELNLLYVKGPYCDEFERNAEFTHWLPYLAYIWSSFIMVVKDSEFIHYVWYTSMCVLGVYYPIFFSILLLDVVFRFPTLTNVLSAVTVNRKQLQMTAMLGIIIIYIYSFWGFTISNPMYDDKFIGRYGDNLGQNLWQTFLTTLNFGLRMGGGIGDVLSKIEFWDKKNYYIRFVYDLSFFLIVVIMLLNIIFGIIIDTFAQLRDQKNFREDDMKMKCFICNLERSLFDRHSYGFAKHIAEDHNVWQYIYFLVHLRVKDKTEFDGAESFCYKLIQEKDNSWIPLHKAICLKHIIEKEHEKEDLHTFMMAKIEALEKQIEELTQYVNAQKMQ